MFVTLTSTGWHSYNNLTTYSEDVLVNHKWNDHNSTSYLKFIIEWEILASGPSFQVFLVTLSPSLGVTAYEFANDLYLSRN